MKKDTTTKRRRTRGQSENGNDGGDDDDADLLDEDDYGEGDADMDYDPLDQIRSSCLYQMAVPEKFYLKKYGDLIQDLFKQNILPLGLYRLLNP